MNVIKRIDDEVKQIYDADLRRFAAYVIEAASARLSARRARELDRILMRACGTVFFAKCLCDVWEVGRTERDIAVTVCLVRCVLRLLEVDPADCFRGNVEVERVLSISYRIASFKGRTRRLAELAHGTKAEIIVGLSLVLHARID